MVTDWIPYPKYRDVITSKMVLENIRRKKECEHTLKPIRKMGFESTLNSIRKIGSERTLNRKTKALLRSLISQN